MKHADVLHPQPDVRVRQSLPDPGPRRPGGDTLNQAPACSRAKTANATVRTAAYGSSLEPASLFVAAGDYPRLRLSRTVGAVIHG